MPRSSALRASVLGLLTLVLASTGILAAGSAGAVAVPYAPAYHAGIDPYSSYEPESTCSPKAKAGVVAYRDLIDRTYGALWSNIARACSASVSGHEEGRALDWGRNAAVASQKAQADALLGWLLATDKHGNKHAMARRLGIQYIQYNNMMWRAYGANAGWQPQMLGGKACSTLGASYKTSCHRDHIHTSFSWAGANKKTSYFTGMVACPTPATQPAFTAALPVNMSSAPIAPARLLDTRKGTGACRLAPKGTLDVKVTGVGGVPSTGVGAVALNIVGLVPTGPTFLSVYPAGTVWNGSSSLNVPAKVAADTMVIVPVGSNGMVTIRNNNYPIDVIADVVGYFTTASTGTTYSTVDQQNVLDTHQTSIMAAGERRVLPIAGHYGVPVGATGVLVNVTSSGSIKGGYVTVAPSIGPVVTSSTLNYAKTDTAANRAITLLSSDGSIEVLASTQSHLRVDVLGWFGSGGQGLRYNPVLPTKILDTRNGTGGVATLVGGVTADVSVTGRGGIPTDAHSLVGSLTLVKPTARTNVSMWAAGDAQPAGPDVSVPAGTVREFLATPELSGDDGQAALEVDTGSSNAVLYVLGYFR